jgi:hypothetical protein
MPLRKPMSCPTAGVLRSSTCYCYDTCYVTHTTRTSEKAQVLPDCRFAEIITRRPLLYVGQLNLRFDTRLFTDTSTPADHDNTRGELKEYVFGGVLLLSSRAMVSSKVIC